ncbi:MAG: dicarboxylate/amino acid:cation symporter [Clostridiales bacterium]|nr:dicarboxylate/amino acid:cation symporter [Clostridiales bacterium]MCD8367750.1 dicarboxylate/amino acid:cation symporter [Clostridiales bacterium]
MLKVIGRLNPIAFFKGIWPVLLSVFAIHILGLEYTAAQYAFLVVLAVVVSVGTVGVPGTATITATAVFAAAGLPVEVIVLLSPISSIVDMARTATNVVGAATAATLVAATEEGQLDRDAYQQDAGGKDRAVTTTQSV